MTQQQRDIKRKLAVLEYAKQSGNVAKTCRRFGISRQGYYNWLRAFERHGEAGLVNRGPCPENHSLRTPKPIEEKIMAARRQPVDAVAHENVVDPVRGDSRSRGSGQGTRRSWSARSGR